MAKRLKTYRIDGKLDDAAAAKAARIGCTVTDVIVRAIEEFIKDEQPPRRSRRAKPSDPPPTMPSAGPPPRPRKAQPAACSHRLPSGAYCKTCERSKP